MPRPTSPFSGTSEGCYGGLSDEIKNLGRDIEIIYTPIEEANEEILRRRKDTKLTRKVNNFLRKENIPEALRESPKAVLARFILSPNFELLHFLELAKKVKLQPLCLEYLEDKFVAGNIDKYYLCKLYFRNSKDKEKKDNVTVKKIINFSGDEGRKLCDLKTVQGESLKAFHGTLMDISGLSSDIGSFDISNYYKINGGTANKYYLYFFALFLCHGILFENYLLNKIHLQFTRDVVLANFQNIYELFGIKPLVVRLGPIGDEENLYWRHYPGSIKNKISF